jgi:hypothetical protein
MATTVNLLMFLPLNDLKVVVTLYAVETNQSFVGQFPRHGAAYLFVEGYQARSFAGISFVWHRERELQQQADPALQGL